MKRLLISIVLVGAVTVLAGCCSNGTCGAYTNSYYTVPVSTCSTCGVRPVRPVCGTCAVSNTCSTCGYGFGYNDWY